MTMKSPLQLRERQRFLQLYRGSLWDRIPSPHSSLGSLTPVSPISEYEELPDGATPPEETRKSVDSSEGLSPLERLAA